MTNATKTKTSGHCDLCGCESDRLDRVEDLWGLGVSTMCADASECAATWGDAFASDPNETAVLPPAALLFNDLDKADPPHTATRRLPRQ